MKAKTYIILLLVCFSCKDVYQPAIKDVESFLLVVEGVLNAGSGSSVINLSRTTSLNSDRRIPEVNAQVIVESKSGPVGALEEKSNGRYVSDQLGLQFNQEYRIIIHAAGKKYVSEYMIARKAPAIDSISWRRNDDGVTIEVTTHDQSNNTRYYKWEYEETWEINSMFNRSYKYDNGSVLPISQSDPEVYRCWKFFNSATVLVGTSSLLSSDVIDRAKLTFIPTAAERLSVRYSILVRQYAIDKKAFEFFELMRKNTEALGTIFDPQPFEMDGNIKCETSPSEKVIGYVFASSSEERRIFINNSEVPGWKFMLQCDPRLVKNHPDSIRKFMPEYLPYSAVLVGLSITDYYSAIADCVDCRVRGGMIVRPSFW